MNACHTQKMVDAWTHDRQGYAGTGCIQAGLLDHSSEGADFRLCAGHGLTLLR